MEQLDEPDQPISGGRQEFRKRRRPSQPMVDKALQTEGTEKKKLTTTPQSSGPKATFSAGNLPASKGNYSAKESESHSISSQLQQSWTKRKRGQEMAHKSLQTDRILKGRQDFKFIDETVIPEEKPAGTGKTASEFPEQVQEVEVPTSNPSIQLKIDRSQQTSCTGAMLSLLQVEKDDKAQQTSFSALEFMVDSSLTSPLTKSKKDTQTDKSPENACVIKHPEFQPEMSSHEKIKQKNANRVLFTSETKEDTPVLSGDGSRAEATVPVEEGSFVTKGALVEVEALPTEQIPAVEAISAEVRPSPAEEVVEKAELSLAERLTAEAAIITANVFVLVQSAGQLPPVGSSSSGERIRKKSYDQEGYPSAEISLFEASYPDGQPLMAEMSQVEILPPIVEDAHEDTLSKVEPSVAEENPAELSPPLTPESFAEELLTEIQPLSAEEALAEEDASEFQAPAFEEVPEEEAPAEMWSPSADKAHVEEAPAEVQLPSAQEAFVEEGLGDTQPLSAEEALAEEAPAEVQPPPAEEAPAEVQPPPAEEASAEVQPPPAEEAPAEVQPPPAQEAPAEVQPSPAEEAPGDVQPPPAKEAPGDVQPPPGEEVPGDVQPPPAEEAPAEVQPPPGKEAPGDVQPPPAEEAPAEVQPPPAEEAPAEVQPPSTVEAPDQVQLLSAEETPGKVVSAHIQSLQAEKFPADGEPAKVKLLLAEKASPERASISVWSPIVEVSEVYSSSLEETSVEEAESEVQPPPAGEL